MIRPTRCIGRVSKQRLLNFIRDLLFIERFTSSGDHDVSRLRRLCLLCPRFKSEQTWTRLDVEFSKSAMVIGIVYGCSHRKRSWNISFINSPKQTCTLSAVVQVSSDQFCPYVRSLRNYSPRHSQVLEIEVNTNASEVPFQSITTFTMQHSTLDYRYIHLLLSTDRHPVDSSCAVEWPIWAHC